MRAAIIGLSGPAITEAESALLRRCPPAGVILFARNIEEPAQLSRLIQAVRADVPGALVMVDQEGGRVARLRAPHWLEHPPAREAGALYARDQEAGRRAAWLTGALIGAQCADAGFDVVAAPVLDVASLHGHDVIGDRAFSGDAEAVAALGEAMARGLLAAGIQPVGKHAPGHGRARADSHLELPTLPDVEPAELIPFRANAWLPWMMTAHIRYTALDMDNPGTHSAAVTGLIRSLGFAGVLVTDDLAMHALTGTPGERAARALAAGCDLALHCSGILAQSEDVLSAVPELDGASAARLEEARLMARQARQTLDARAMADERARLLP